VSGSFSFKDSRSKASYDQADNIGQLAPPSVIRER